MVTGSITFGYVTNRCRYTTIFVEDTGSGISEDAQKHILNAFYKEEQFYAGRRFGLAIARTIRPPAWFYLGFPTELGKGTRFEVVIPDANE